MTEDAQVGMNGYLYLTMLIKDSTDTSRGPPLKGTELRRGGFPDRGCADLKNSPLLIPNACAEEPGFSVYALHGTDFRTARAHKEYKSTSFNHKFSGTLRSSVCSLILKRVSYLKWRPVSHKLNHLPPDIEAPVPVRPYFGKSSLVPVQSWRELRVQCPKRLRLFILDAQAGRFVDIRSILVVSVMYSSAKRLSALGF